MDRSVEITKYLSDARKGDSEAFNLVYSQLYDELRSIAHRQLFHQPRGETLNTTALVHEAYERLVGNSQIDWQDRNHFYALTSRAMRYILVDYARRCSAKKRGGDKQKVSLDAVQLAIEERSAELEALDEALSQLSSHNKQLEQLVELKFFGGLTYKEIAGIMDRSERSLRRDWQRARTWIYSAMQQEK
ncbi:sigma-70 family RNA polymerase sigma factor [Rhodohalobacter sp. SW132]|uniref:ECF-type sigma factor n=1 Tax=Rhodohalobacter sp. SW132 TaxID=2293433 RepID=UPI000E27A7B7|nr:ECF-type sigma factor [Rhodohalobacter sp. SW132]REL24228.1 sigma-70 family RNA polymerase sigma factor [Rhodohalobacter sp. SW132]